MYGIENITANDGWAMAAVGATIVFLGLVVLSFVISQIHKILELFEKKDEPQEPQEVAPPPDAPLKLKSQVYKVPQMPTVKDLVSIYRPLVEQLNEPFELPQLFEISNKMNLAHPHLSIKQLWDADVLIAQGDGTFTWNKQKGN